MRKNVIKYGKKWLCFDYEKYSKKYAKEQEYAKNNKLGIWKINLISMGKMEKENK